MADAVCEKLLLLGIFLHNFVLSSRFSVTKIGLGKDISSINFLWLSTDRQFKSLDPFTCTFNRRVFGGLSSRIISSLLVTRRAGVGIILNARGTQVKIRLVQLECV